MDSLTSNRTGRTYHSVRLCDACGAGSRETALVALGINGLSVFTAQLCERCASDVELGVERIIRGIEAERLERRLVRLRG